MTCIVGVIHKGKVIIGADSAGVAGLDITIRKDPKVFKVGEFIIGCTSSFRMIQLLRFSFTPPIRHPDTDIYQYMCTDFVNTVRACFKAGGYAEKSNEVEKGGVFLIGWRDRLFKIESDYQVCEGTRLFEACGCGDPYAIGAMDALEGKLDGEALVLKALEIASNHSAGVAPPFIVLTTNPADK